MPQRIVRTAALLLLVMVISASAVAEIVHFDPRTEKFGVPRVPGAGGVIRNMAATRTGRVYVAESGVNTVGMIEPALRTAEPSPIQPASASDDGGMNGGMSRALRILG